MKKVDLKKHPHVASYGSIGYGFIKKYPGMCLDDIAAMPNNEGIKYLDWLLGQEWLRPYSRGEIEAFLTHFHLDAWESLLLDDD